MINMLTKTMRCLPSLQDRTVRLVDLLVSKLQLHMAVSSVQCC